MTVGHNDNVALSNALFEVASMIFLHHVNDCIDPLGYLVRTFASREADSPTRPMFVLLLDLVGCNPLIISVVPLTDFFSESM